MNHFFNAFIRQIGREVGHDTYNGLKSQSNMFDGQVEYNEATIKKCTNTKMYLIIFLLPLLLSIFGEVIALVYMMKTWYKTTTKYRGYGIVGQYKCDLRYKDGIRYAGDTIKKFYVEKPSTEEEIKTRRGIILIGLLFQFLYFGSIFLFALTAQQ